MFYFSEPGDVARAFECAIQSGGSNWSVFESISITDLLFHSARSFLRTSSTKLQGRAQTSENFIVFLHVMKAAGSNGCKNK